MGGLHCFAEIRAAATAKAELKLPDEQCPLVRVRGRVVHHDRRPAAGAQIVVAPQGRAFAEVIGEADAAGRFEVSIARGFLLLGARLAGYAPSPQQSFRDLDDVEIVLPGPGAGVAGIVVDADSKPVGNAIVQIGEPRLQHQWVDPSGYLMEAPVRRLLYTGSDGRFAAEDLIADEINVFVRADGFAPFHCYVHTAAGKTIEVRCQLAPGIVVRGRVIDQAGAPVVGANVYLGGTYGEYRTTDAEGRFGYRHVAPGPQRLEVSDEGIARTYCERGETEVGEWTVVVRRWPQFLLRFVDELGGPLVGWRVELRPSDMRIAGTDAAGRVALPAVGDGPHSLWLAPPGGLHAVMPFTWPPALASGVETTIVVPTAQQPAAILSGTVLGPEGAPLATGTIEVRGNDDSYLYRQRLEAGRFRFERVPAGDWVIEVHRQGRGAAGGRFPVGALQHREVRDLGELRLPDEGSLQVRVVLADGSTPRDASVFLWDREGREHQGPPRDGQPHPWPEGRYTWKVMENDSLWQSGACEVRAGETASIEVVLQPAVCRYLMFPVPRPDWGEPKRIDYVLRAPDGSVYDASDFDPREEMPFRYMPALCLGTWRVELTLDDGRRFVGAFKIDSMAPSREPIQVAVEPTR